MRMGLRYIRMLVVGVAVCTLGGCRSSYFVPMELAPFHVESRTTLESPEGAPAIHVQTHPDGLGWTVSVTQPWTETVTQQEQEIWNGYRYQPSQSRARQISLTLLSPLTCAGSAVAHFLVWGKNVLGLFEGPAPTWKLFSKYCVVPMNGLDPAQETWTAEPATAVEQHTLRSVRQRQLTDGRVQLQWLSPFSDPLAVEYPLSATQPMIDVRLRDLAGLVNRDRTPPHLRTGHAQLQFVSSQGEPIVTSLDLSAHTLEAALRSDLVKRPDREWPASQRILVTSNRDSLKRFTERTLTQLGLPIVSRGNDTRVLVDLQQQEVSPLYAEPATTTIGHWVGATVLLSLQATPHHRNREHTQITAVDVETGTILGQVTIETPLPMTPDAEGLLRGELEALITSRATQRRQGLLIEDHR